MTTTVSTENKVEVINLYFDPTLDNPPRNGKVVINGIDFLPNTVTQVTPEQLEMIKGSQYGKFLLDVGAIKVVSKTKHLEKVSIASLPVDKAREMIFAEVSIEQLREWQKSEKRPEIRKDIISRISELKAE